MLWIWFTRYTTKVYFALVFSALQSKDALWRVRKVSRGLACCCFGQTCASGARIRSGESRARTRKEDFRYGSRPVSTSQLRGHWRTNPPFRSTHTSARGCLRRNESHFNQTKLGRSKCKFVCLNLSSAYEHQKPLESAVKLVKVHLFGPGLVVVPQALQIQ